MKGKNEALSYTEDAKLRLAEMKLGEHIYSLVHREYVTVMVFSLLQIH
jgi:hypothetical protein